MPIAIRRGLFCAGCSILALIFGALAASGATIHVAPHGSNTPPYDSYAKAAHRINDAVALAEAGDTVRIGAGVHPVDSTIILKNSFVTICGAGQDSTLIVPDTTLQYCFFASGYEYSADFGFTFSDLTVYGQRPKTYSLSKTNLFWLDGRYRPPTIQEMVFRRCRLIGGRMCLEVSDCPLTVEGCIFEDYSYGIHMWGAGPHVMRNNRFETQRVSVAIRFSPDATGPITIDHNTILGGYSSQFVSTDYSTHMRVTNNYVDVVGTAMLLEGHDVYAANNLIIAGVGHGYRLGIDVLFFDLGPTDSVVFENNTVITRGDDYIGMNGPKGFDDWAPARLSLRYNSLWGFNPVIDSVFRMNHGWFVLFQLQSDRFRD